MNDGYDNKLETQFDESLSSIHPSNSLPLSADDSITRWITLLEYNPNQMIKRSPQVHNQDEPEALKSLSKHSLYKMLSADYFLPPRDSRGVSRTYLVGVYTHKYFRVGNIELKKFMAELTPFELKKAVFIIKAETHYKVEQLLRETGKNELGFKSGLIPDDVWLYQMARYIDKYNTADIFEIAVCSPSILMLIARR